MVATGRGVSTQVSAYAVRYRFDLFSNFSYTRGWLRHGPAAAAMRYAARPWTSSSRWIAAAFHMASTRSSRATSGWPEWTARTYGADLRRDQIAEVGCSTFQRQRLTTVRRPGGPERCRTVDAGRVAA